MLIQPNPPASNPHLTDLPFPLWVGKNAFISEQSGYGIDVGSFGVKGDGVHDDTEAIQDALDYASSHNIPLIMSPPAVSYLISETLIMSSNTNIIGYNTKIEMKSRASLAFMLVTSSSVYTNNISISGLVLESQNDRAGDVGSYYEGTMVSNVSAIGFRGATNVNLSDITIKNMLSGVHFVPNQTPTNYNKTITARDLRILNTATPMLIKNTRDFFLSGSVLDSTGFNNSHLHCLYIDTDCQNIYLDSNQLQNNLAGAGIQIYSEEQVGLINGVFNNNTVTNCDRGTTIYTGATKISYSGLNVLNCNKGIDANNCDGVAIFGGTFAIKTNALYMENTKNMLISGINIDAVDATGYDLIHLLGVQKNVVLDALIIKNIHGDKYMISGDDPDLDIQSLTIQNCVFDFNNPDPDNVMPLYFANSGADVLIQNNRFKVSTGTPYYYLIYAVTGTHIVAKNNHLTGFGKMAALGFSVLDSNTLDGKPSRASGSVTISDGGSITHGLPNTPTSVRVSGSVASELLSITSKSSTTFTVAIKTLAGAAGTSQTVYWEAEYNA